MTTSCWPCCAATRARPPPEQTPLLSTNQPALLTPAALHAVVGGELALTWTNAPTGGGNRLRPKPCEDADAPWVARLDLLRPAPVQVWDRRELDFFERLDPAVRQALQQRVVLDCAALVLACNQRLPAAFQATCEAAGVAVLRSPLAPESLVHRLREWLQADPARRCNWHGVLMDVFSVGVLISGKSGVGKSELALELLSRGHRLIADDAPELTVTDGSRLRGRCPEPIRDFLEVRGLGVLDVRALFGDHAVGRQHPVSLLISLVNPHGEPLPKPDRIHGARRTRRILGISVPEITLPVAIGHNLAVLVETACRDHRLRAQGLAGDERFVRRHDALLAEDQ